jgi:hypothetical protein
VSGHNDKFVLPSDVFEKIVDLRETLNDMGYEHKEPHAVAELPPTECNEIANLIQALQNIYARECTIINPES